LSPAVSGRFPPRSRSELAALGWDECDVVIVSGDAYVDHPAFGAAVIARVLEAAGCRVGVISQPRWDRPDDFKVLGRPRLFFGVTAGNVDSMVAHYSPLKQQRRADAYSPAGRFGLRPNRAVIVYANRLRAVFPGVPLVLGGIEASLRRLAHYDYWDDAVRRSILLDAKADIIAYGTAEAAVVEIARRLAQASSPMLPAASRLLTGIPGTVIVRGRQAIRPDGVVTPSFDAVQTSRDEFNQAFMLWYREADQPHGRPVIQPHGDRFVVQYPPAAPLSSQEIDRIYDLPFTRSAHPGYAERIPALETVKFSITSHRGCLGSCTFCSLAAHQGRVIQWRSRESIVREARQIAAMPGFRGHITDVGGPTANMYGATCTHLARAEPCRDRACLYPERCPNLKHDFARQLEVLDAVSRVPGVKKVSLGTGLRYDLIRTRDRPQLERLAARFVSGQLRVAPEHVSDRVLELMRKSGHRDFVRFQREWCRANKAAGPRARQYLIPYFISGFPGCTPEDMIELAEFLSRSPDMPRVVQQVQDFTPLPMTLAGAMYYTGIDPFTGRRIPVARALPEKRLQRALLQLHLPENRAYVLKHLRRSGERKLLARAARVTSSRRRTPGAGPGHAEPG
jgi:uncharacterized radical SAM protein YgiQ